MQEQTVENSELLPARRGDVVRLRLRKMAAVLLSVVVIVTLIGAGYVIYQAARGVGGMQVRKLEAQAGIERGRADQAQAQVALVDERQQTLTLLPGMVASLMDSLMVAAYAAGDRFLNVVLVAALVWALVTRGRRDG